MLYVMPSDAIVMLFGIFVVAGGALNRRGEVRGAVEAERIFCDHAGTAGKQVGQNEGDQSY